MSGLYDSALAQVHAEGFAATYAAGFDWLAARIGARPDARLFDLGCGDGTWLSFAAAAGIPGAGADLSPAFVAMARARGFDVRRSTAARAPIPDGTTAITALGEVLSYVDPDLDGPSLAPVLLHASQALPPGGMLIADLIGPDTPARIVETEGDGWQMRSEVTLTGMTLTRRITLTTARGTETTTHRQAVLSPESVRDEARALGLHAELLAAYGPAPLLPGRFALMAVKP